MALKPFVNSVFGIDLSSDGINSLQLNMIDGQIANIASKNLKLNKKFDLIMLPMVIMYIANNEFENLISNLVKLTKNNGYIYISDFLVKDSKINVNQHDTRINIFKRNLDFYLNNLREFNLLEFKILDYNKLEKLKITNNFIIKDNIPKDDNDWAFVGIWQKEI